MDLTEFMDQLALDLKITLGTEVSVAEATRCIHRAVDDYSRFSPRERIYELTYVKVVTDDDFTTPAATDTDKIVDAEGLVDTEDGDTCTLATTWMDVPRPVVVTITDDNESITRMTVIVKGTDADGVCREERFYRHGGLIQTGKIYFSSIREVEVNEMSGSDTNDTLDVGTGAGTGLWIQLDNPIEPESESIYSAALKAGTLYVRGTDYYMDYANGRIQIISGGDMAEDTTYYTNYNKSTLAIDISSILPDITRIVKVVYPVDKIPEQEVAWSIWENMLIIGSPRAGVSQEAMVNGEHLAIYYETKHAPPTDVAAGSFPSVMDQVIAMGAAGYALLVEALQWEHQAATDLAEIGTTLGYLGIGTGTSTLLYKAIEDALDKVTLYLETNDTTDNAKDVLSNITDDIALLREAISKADSSGALDIMNAYLDSVNAADLSNTTYGAETMLSTGMPLINKLNDGKNVPEIYASYAIADIQKAQARTQAALGYAQEAGLRITNLRSYIEEAGGWMRMGEDFMAEAQGRMAEAGIFLAEAAQYQESIANDLLLSDRYRAEGQIRLNQFFESLKSRAEYRKRTVSVSVRQPG